MCRVCRKTPLHLEGLVQAVKHSIKGFRQQAYLGCSPRDRQRLIQFFLINGMDSPG